MQQSVRPAVNGADRHPLHPERREQEAPDDPPGKRGLPRPLDDEVCQSVSVHLLKMYFIFRKLINLKFLES